MVAPHIENEPTERDRWFETLIVALRGKWAKTGHTGKRRSGRWACEVFNKCSTCNEHVSIACSLAGEADNVGLFLGKSWEAEEFSLFSQLYLIMLCEFVRNLQKVGDVVGVELPNPPKRVLVWGNNFAKHRLHILVQHHPAWVVADAYGDDWQEFQKIVPSCGVVDRCGVRHDIEVIDYDWLADLGRRKCGEANSDRHPVFVIPPLGEFLDDTMRYFRRFVDVCLANESLLRQFESEHYTAACW